MSDILFNILPANVSFLLFSPENLATVRIIVWTRTNTSKKAMYKTTATSKTSPTEKLTRLVTLPYKPVITGKILVT